jgi:molybdopterin synthase catalytic subunit
VLAACASAHRKDALEACAFLIDRLKTDAPFWKRESFADGREVWVEARGSDDAAAARWG